MSWKAHPRLVCLSRGTLKIEVDPPPRLGCQGLVSIPRSPDLAGLQLCEASIGSGNLSQPSRPLLAHAATTNPVPREPHHAPTQAPWLADLGHPGALLGTNMVLCAL